MNHKIKHKLPRNLRTPFTIYAYDEEKPYASPTTHFEVRLSSTYNRNRLRDNKGSSLLS